MSALLRPARAGDAADLAAIYAPAVRDGATSFELEPPDAAEMARRVAATAAHTPWLVCELGGRCAGYAYASRHRERPAYRWAVEVSAYVHDDARRSGVARALYAALLELLALQGFRTALAGITLPNPASVALHETSGFTRVGVFRRVGWKLGAWHDVLWLERPLGAYAREPRPPLAWPALLADQALVGRTLGGAAALVRLAGPDQSR